MENDFFVLGFRLVVFLGDGVIAAGAQVIVDRNVAAAALVCHNAGRTTFFVAGTHSSGSNAVFKVVENCLYHLRNSDKQHKNGIEWMEGTASFAGRNFTAAVRIVYAIQ